MHNNLPSNYQTFALLPDIKMQCQSLLEWIFTPIDQVKAPIWAEKLTNAFGSLPTILAADVDLTADVLDHIYEPALYLKQWHNILGYVIKSEVLGDSIFDKWNIFLKYLNMEMGLLKVEQVRAIFLDSGHLWIGEEIIATGTIKEVQCYPREVARRAVVLYASSVILVHNHPSGNPEMSREDKSMTYAIQESCRAVGVALYDHLVICRDCYSSFRNDNPLWSKI